MLSIVCLAAGAAVTYGIVNDQFLAHLSVQYFTIGHVDYLGNGHPEVLAFEWGFLGTWWVGLTLGIPVALVANVGRAPRLGARDFVGPVLLLVSLMAVAAAIAWIAAYTLASSGNAFIANVVRPGVSPGQRFLTMRTSGPTSRVMSSVRWGRWRSWLGPGGVESLSGVRPVRGATRDCGRARSYQCWCRSGRSLSSSLLC